MENLSIQTELSPLEDIILRPHNDVAKVYSFFGLQPDPRFGNGCLHQAFDVVARVSESRILWDPVELHFAVQLRDGSYFDPAWTQRTLPETGIARILDDAYIIKIMEKKGYKKVKMVSGGWEGRPYRMTPYDGSF